MFKIVELYFLYNTANTKSGSGAFLFHMKGLCVI